MPGKERNLEVKALDPDPQATLEAAVQRDRFEQLRAVLGISEEPLVARGYADLVA